MTTAWVGRASPCPDIVGPRELSELDRLLVELLRELEAARRFAGVDPMDTLEPAPPRRPQ